MQLVVAFVVCSIPIALDIMYRQGVKDFALYAAISGVMVLVSCFIFMVRCLADRCLCGIEY